MNLLSKLFSCQHMICGDDLPEEKFAVISGRVDDQPVVGSLNMAYIGYKKKERYPWCLKIMIGLDLENLFENGLPQPEENEIANKLENELLAEIKMRATAHYIGHLFNDTFLDVYVYLDRPEKVHAWLQTQVNKQGLVRGFGYEISKDPTWEIVEGFLKQQEV